MLVRQALRQELKNHGGEIVSKRVTVCLDGLLLADVEALAAKLKVKTGSKFLRELVQRGISAIRAEERTKTA